MRVRVRVRAEVRGRVSRVRLGRGRRWRRRAPCTAALLQLGDLVRVRVASFELGVRG